MEDLSKLLIEVYSKGFAYQASVGRPLSATFTARHSGYGIGSGTVTLDADDDAVTALATPGARLWVRYRYNPDDDTQLLHVMSGLVREVDIDGPVTAPTRTFQVTDDLDYLWNRMLCWPVPGSAITAQGGSSTYDTRTGPIETVVKALVTANKAKLPAGAPTITVEANAARGSSVTVSMRFMTIADRLAGGLTGAGVGFRARQSGTGILFEAYTPSTLTVPLSAQSGEVSSRSGAIKAPQYTRTIVRGGSDTTAVFREVVNTTAEAAYGWTGTTYLEVSETTDTTTLDLRGQAQLATFDASASLALVLAETADWRVGTVINLGDTVPVDVDDGTVITDTVSEVEYALTVDGGLRVTPKVGDQTDAVGAIVQAIQKIAGAQRVQRARG